MLVDIHFSGLKELKASLNKVENHLGDNVSREIATNLVHELKGVAPKWKGNLRSSIQSRKTKDGYNIHMLYYGQKLEEGFTINPGLHIILKWWAIDKLGKDYGLVWFRGVTKFGHIVTPNPWITGGIDKTMKKFPSIAEQGVRITFKEAGLK